MSQAAHIILPDYRDGMTDEYGVILASPPGPVSMIIYLWATDDEHALEQVSSRWAPDDVVAVVCYPRGDEAGLPRRVWPR